MKGIILAGGTGSRLYPLTQSVNKQLLPVYDVPLIYYPMATLMNAGIREICIISSPDYIPAYKKLFKNGRHLGLNISYEIQEKPEGIAQAFIIGKEFIKNDSVMLVLGDNIFHGNIDYSFFSGAKVFAYEVSNPQDYGVVNLDAKGKAISIVEKPKAPISNLAVPGLYFYDESVFEKAREVKPSERGEFEITSINQMYLDEGTLSVEILQRGTAWLDTGSVETLYEAASFIRVLQERQGYKIACLEEIAFRNQWLTEIEIMEIMDKTKSNELQRYLNMLLDETLIHEAKS
jgi:glucose-1-phosphate thymidylyltransferase